MEDNQQQNEPTPSRLFKSTSINKEDQKATSQAYAILSWMCLIAGFVSYNVGLYNAKVLALSEKGYYFTLIMFGLFSVVCLQKAIRDKIEGIPTTAFFSILGWIGAIVSVGLLVIGLFNAELELSEKGFYAIAFVLTLYSTISVQKNLRDDEYAKKHA